jgi:hypothetical protein
MSCEEAYEEMTKTLPALLNSSTEEEARIKPGDDVTTFMQGLAAKFFLLHGDTTTGTAGSEFFLGFLAKSHFTPWFRWCKDHEPALKYKVSEDKWYKIFGNMVQARNSRKRKPEPAAAVPHKVACVAAAAAAAEEDPADAESATHINSQLADLMAANKELKRELKRMEARLDNANRGTHHQSIRRDDDLGHRISRLEESWGKTNLLASTKVLPVARKQKVKVIRKAAPVEKVTACQLLPLTANYCQLLPVT